MNEENLKIFIDKVKNAKTILIAGHKNPDGDSLCSVLAMARLIEMNVGTRPLCVYDGNIPDNLDNMPRRPYIKYYERADLTQPFDLAILMDYGTERHIGGVRPALDAAKFVIEIDHHKNDSKIGNLCIDDEGASATAEIVYDIMRALDWSFDTDVATLLVAGIMTDTGNFKYARNGTPMRIVGDLVDNGVNVRRLLDSMSNRPRKSVLTEADVVAHTEFFHHGRLAIATVPRSDYKNLDGRGDLILGTLAQIKGVEYIVLMKHQKENQIGLSLRGRMRPVNHIAAALGGGGHEFAAGAVINDMSIDDAKKKIIEMFKGA